MDADSRPAEQERCDAALAAPTLGDLATLTADLPAPPPSEVTAAPEEITAVLGNGDRVTRKVLYIIVCGAPPARDVSRLARAAQEKSWDVCVLATPSAVKFINPAALTALTGHPVRADYKDPGDSDSLPPPDAVIVAPVTVNTINKWAAGICDTLALGILVEGIGKRLPIIALPFTNYAQAAHPAFEPNIEKLRSWGVKVLYGADVYPLHAPGTGDSHLDEFPWTLTLEALD